MLPELIQALFLQQDLQKMVYFCYVLSLILLQEKGYVTADVAKEQ